MRAYPVVLLTVLLGAAGCGDAGSDTVVAGEPLAATTTSQAPAPVDHGAWRDLPEAPIGTRPYAVAGWSGSEAVFWAGSNLRRDFAHTTGAAFDPATDTWRQLAVPGWGHPGLAGAVLDGRLYAAAKGGVHSLDLTDGSAPDLPEVPGFIPATVVATDTDLWAVGPANDSGEEPVALGIARYDPAAGAWVAGPGFAGVAEMGPLFQDLLFVEQAVLWTGASIVVWNPEGRGLSFDPAAGEWRLLPAIPAADGTVTGTRVAVAGSRLVALAQVHRDGAPGYGVASWDGSAWTWRDTSVQVADFAAVSIAGAGDFVVVLAPDGPPQTIHVPTGDSHRHVGAPIGGLQAPATVWTGAELVVWGGVPTRSEGNSIPPVAAAWVPPAR